MYIYYCLYLFININIELEKDPNATNYANTFSKPNIEIQNKRVSSGRSEDAISVELGWSV